MKEWGAVKQLTNETPSKGRLDQTPLMLVSNLLHFCRHPGAEEPSLADQAGPKIKAKAEATKEALEDATPSEQAVRLSLNALFL